jgi:hypothetical protein
MAAVEVNLEDCHITSRARRPRRDRAQKRDEDRALSLGAGQNLWPLA